MPLPNGDRVIYFGGWGKDIDPSSPSGTYATVFDGNHPDELAGFTLRVEPLEGQPAFDQQPGPRQHDSEPREVRLAALPSCPSSNPRRLSWSHTCTSRQSAAPFHERSTTRKTLRQRKAGNWSRRTGAGHQPRLDPS